ncbi:hypothetical protein [Nioella nitratireducens]|uniref:hypothetical protein n=1 Tax=Nioella nitratireducens TaxID=1287720 RepID=UPI0011BAC0D5|nr:hypothetical protein [Nioella nitratireducens]
MDYGYRMLRHVVRQVFGNLGQAARLTLLLTFLPMALMLLYFLNAGLDMSGMGSMGGMQNTGTMDPATMPNVNAGTAFLVVLAGIVVSAVTYCWAAVGWHRFILLEEYGNGILPQWHGPLVMSYIGRAILIGIVVFLIALLSMFALGMVMFAVRSMVLLTLVAAAWTMGLSWVITRIGLILPAAALGRPMTIRESWEATKPVSGDLLVPLFFIAVAVTVANQIVAALFAGSALAMIPLAILYWLQVLLNLSLMTTLFGTQIEGRQLS